jgi:hypothetical protein
MTPREKRIEEFKEGLLHCFPFEDPQAIDLQARDFLADRAAFWHDSAVFWRDEYCKLREDQEDDR